MKLTRCDNCGRELAGGDYITVAISKPEEQQEEVESNGYTMFTYVWGSAEQRPSIRAELCDEECLLGWVKATALVRFSEKAKN